MNMIEILVHIYLNEKMRPVETHSRNGGRKG
jgi:hypothetical protein